MDPIADDGSPKVLVVTPGRLAESVIGGWLEAAGYDVLTCPGPREPDYACVGSRSGTCPLAKGADAVVLDLWLDSDTIARGTPGWELMLFYAGLGLPLVVLSGPEDAVHPLPDARTKVLARPPRRENLLRDVASLVRAVAAP
jgi:hypothetical protein